jgi:ABC-type transporter Mla MlaB component
LVAPKRPRSIRVRAWWPRGERGTVVLAIGGPIAPGDVPEIWERVRVYLDGRADTVVLCDMEAPVDPDVVTIDALARLQLAARRAGCQVRLHHACDELQDLLALTGLSEVVPVAGGSAVEPSGKAEEREPARGVEEEADPADAIP